MKQAFTLIELSIVLVIIGLIVGGVLVGRDLIWAAQIRAEVKQLETIETAVNTFRVKYNCLPGDCMNVRDFFGTTDSNGRTINNGDGDGYIRSANQPAPYTIADCLSPYPADEVPQSFLHLYDAGLYGFAADGGATWNGGTAEPPSAMNDNTFVLLTCLHNSPPVVAPPLRRGTTIVIGMPKTLNSRMAYTTGNGGAGQMGTGLVMGTVVQAIDSKIDDGLPLTGRFGVLAEPSGCIVSNAYPSPSATCNGTAALKILN